MAGLSYSAHLSRKNSAINSILLLQRTVHLQHRLLDLHITVITDGKNGGRFRDRHFNSPLHYDITSLIILNMRQICKMKTQNFYTEMQIKPLCFLPAAVL